MENRDIEINVNMADEKVKILEKRIEELENQVFGQCDKEVEYPKGAEELSGTLLQLNSQVDSAIAGRPKIQGFMKRLGEVEKYLDPAYTDELTLSDAAKAEIILAEEDVLREQAKNLEKVKEMSEVLSSEHLNVTDQQSGKLQQLCQVHIKQSDATSELTDEIKRLLGHYNNTINLLSKQFVAWDEKVTQLEAARTLKIGQ